MSILCLITEGKIWNGRQDPWTKDGGMSNSVTLASPCTWYIWGHLEIISKGVKVRNRIWNAQQFEHMLASYWEKTGLVHICSQKPLYGHTPQEQWSLEMRKQTDVATATPYAEGKPLVWVSLFACRICFDKTKSL